VPVTVILSVDKWYSTRNSFFPVNQLWKSGSPTPSGFTFEGGESKTVTGADNGHDCNMKIAVVAGNAVNQTLYQYIDIPIDNENAGESRIFALKQLTNTDRQQINSYVLDWNTALIYYNNGKLLIDLIPGVDIITNAIDVEIKFCRNVIVAKTNSMHDDNIGIFCNIRDEIEKLYENSPAGLNENNDAPEDKLDYTSAYQREGIN
jgi:hypothetical protein